MCSAGALTSCICQIQRIDPNASIDTQKSYTYTGSFDFYWRTFLVCSRIVSGCSDNVDFAVLKARNFFDVDLDGRVYGGIRAAVLNHNNEVGRKVLSHLSTAH